MSQLKVFQCLLVLTQWNNDCVMIHCFKMHLCLRVYVDSVWPLAGFSLLFSRKLCRSSALSLLRRRLEDSQKDLCSRLRSEWNCGPVARRANRHAEEFQMSRSRRAHASASALRGPASIFLPSSCRSANYGRVWRESADTSDRNSPGRGRAEHVCERTAGGEGTNKAREAQKVGSPSRIIRDNPSWCWDWAPRVPKMLLSRIKKATFSEERNICTYPTYSNALASSSSVMSIVSTLQLLLLKKLA